MIADTEHRQACNGRVPLIDMAGMLSLVSCLPARQTSVLLSIIRAPYISPLRSAPVVDLYALTNPQHSLAGPQRVLYNDVPCKYCYRSVCPEHHHACLRGQAWSLPSSITGRYRRPAASDWPE